MRFFLNDVELNTDAPGGMPVLDFVRDVAGLSGTKHACREGDCGACLVLVGERSDETVTYRPVASCLLPLAEVEERHLVTVEGLGSQTLTRVQRAIVDHGASQCGFCTPGIVIALTGYLLTAPHYSLEEAEIAVAGNLCRCTGYVSIRRAIAELVEQLSTAIDPTEDRIAALIREGVLPAGFAEPWTRLEAPAAPPEQRIPVKDRTVLAGGTDLYVQRADELASASPYLIRRALPSRIWTEDRWVHVSATTTAEELKWSPEIGEVVGGIRGFMDLVCSLPIRHRATVAGNIVNASPIGDMTILLLALDSELGISGRDGRRVIPLRTFFKGYKELDLAAGELIEWIRFRRDHGAAAFNFEKVCRRRHLDIASVNSAACLHTDNGRITEAHLSAGGVAPIPLKLERTEALLVGKPVSAATARQAAAAADSEISPISDVRGSADYKRLLLRQLILTHFHVLFGIQEGLVEEAIA